MLVSDVAIPSLKFVGLPFQKILRIYYVSINRPGDIDLLTSEFTIYNASRNFFDFCVAMVYFGAFWALVLMLV